MAEILKVRNLRTWFHASLGIIKAVDGIDLDVTEGRTMAVVGETGSGKSVMALSLMRLIDPPGRIEEGSSIVLRRRELMRLTEKEMEQVRGADISMVFQEPMSSLNPVFPVGDQVLEAITLHQRLPKKAARDKAIEMLSLVGMPTPQSTARQYPHQLSGGLRQRAVIATALSCNPKLLVADEPTSALDVTIQAQILALLKDLQSRLGMSILLITHDFGVVADLADEVAVMYAAKVVERGPVRQVLEDPQHPYTEALLRSVPSAGVRQPQRLKVIPGNVPSGISMPHGCRFWPRCDYAMTRCRSESPPLMQTADGRQSACWLAKQAGAWEDRVKSQN